MARFNRLKINDLYFTQTGLADGIPCILEASGLLPLRLARQRNVIVALDGSTVVQKSQTKGMPIQITIGTIMSDTLDDLIGILNDAEADEQLLELLVTGDEGVFDLSCELTNFTSAGKFENKQVYDVRLDLIVAVVNSAVSPNP